MIEVKDIWKSFGDLEVLKGVNLRVEKGEIVAIVGKSGAGKTTLLQIIGTLDRPTKGVVIINGEKLMAKGDKELAAFRNKHIGFIFQLYIKLSKVFAIVKSFVRSNKPKIKKAVKKGIIEIIINFSFGT